MKFLWGHSQKDRTTEFLWSPEPDEIGNHDYLICIIKAELCKGSSVGQNSAELHKSFHASRQTMMKQLLFIVITCM